MAIIIRCFERPRPAPNWLVQAKAAQTLEELNRDLCEAGDMLQATLDGRHFLGTISMAGEVIPCPAR